MSEADRRSIMTTIILLFGIMSVCIGAVATGTVQFNPDAIRREISSAKRPESDPDFLYAQALDYYNSGNKTMARAVARRATIVSDKYAPAHKLLAAIALRDKDYKGAEAETRRALASDPADRDAQVAYAMSLRGQGRTSDARKLFEAIANDEKTPLMHRNEAESQLSDMPIKKQ